MVVESKPLEIDCAAVPSSQRPLRYLKIIIVIIQEMVQTSVVRSCDSSWCPGSDIRFHTFPKTVLGEICCYPLYH
ncbi:unnamed protein product [Parnassius mnemosyne]|uniref:Uncharacterized protein n=1 Tax=Parnassius mnemosyne TaxID=213953 RepID=A0AAV1K8W1_9NEOP